MIDTQAVTVIGGVVGMLAKFLTSTSVGIRGGVASVAAVVVSLLVCLLYVYTHGGFAIATLWQNFLGFVNVLLVAGGAFHVIENTPAVVASMKGSNQ